MRIGSTLIAAMVCMPACVYSTKDWTKDSGNKES